MSIKISRKHGVNPSIEKCFWCNGDKGIVLLGKLPNDAKAPNEIIRNYDPCDDCKNQWNLGFTFLELIPTDGTIPEIVKGHSPTGRLWVLRNEAVEEMFPSLDMSKGVSYISKEDAITIGLYDAGENQ
jgi:hypothetical protein